MTYYRERDFCRDLAGVYNAIIINYSKTSIYRPCRCKAKMQGQWSCTVNGGKASLVPNNRSIIQVKVGPRSEKLET